MKLNFGNKMKNYYSVARYFLLVVFSFGFASCNNLEKSKQIMLETHKFEGLWQYTLLQTNEFTNKDMDNLPFIKFEENKFVVSINDAIIQRGTQKIILGDKFNGLDVDIVSGIQEGKKYKAIYKTEGDSIIHLCYSEKALPKDFYLENGKNSFLITIEKVR